MEVRVRRLVQVIFWGKKKTFLFLFSRHRGDENHDIKTGRLHTACAMWGCTLNLKTPFNIQEISSIIIQINNK